MTLLQVKDLHVALCQKKSAPLDILRGISFNLDENTILGIVGESGSGKTMTALSIMQLLPDNIEITGGNIIFQGKNLVSEGMSGIRGKEISMIFQDPASSLNPVISVGNQIVEMYRNHFKISRREAKERSIEAMQKVGIPDAPKRFHSFPHQLSGGMNQRIMIAMMALVTRPAVLIADEPTTALDVTVEKRILHLLTDLVRKEGISLILVTHNLGIIAEYADRVIVMNKGLIVEEGDVFQIFENPKESYTKQLIDDVPKL